jgi:hypothetical protein
MFDFIKSTHTKSEVTRVRVNISDSSDILNWSKQLDCSEKELLFCVSKVGTVISTIEKYLQLNREMLTRWIEFQ